MSDNKKGFIPNTEKQHVIKRPSNRQGKILTRTIEGDMILAEKHRDLPHPTLPAGFKDVATSPDTVPSSLLTIYGKYVQAYKDEQKSRILMGKSPISPSDFVSLKVRTSKWREEGGQFRSIKSNVRVAGRQQFPGEPKFPVVHGATFASSISLAPKGSEPYLRPVSISLDNPKWLTQLMALYSTHILEMEIHKAWNEGLLRPVESFVLLSKTRIKGLRGKVEELEQQGLPKHFVDEYREVLSSAEESKKAAVAMINALCKKRAVVGGHQTPYRLLHQGQLRRLAQRIQSNDFATPDVNHVLLRDAAKAFQYVPRWKGGPYKKPEEYHNCEDLPAVSAMTDEEKRICGLA